jgi:sortase A
MCKRGWLLWLGGALTFGGAAVLAWFSWTLRERDTAQRFARERLTRSMRVPHDEPPRPVRYGDVVGELDIPRLHVSVMVFEGDDAGVLRQGAGHIPGTALPAAGGNDVLVLTTSAGTSRYAVTETRIVQPSNIDVLTAAPERDLTLVTCYPFFYIGHAPERFVVHARKIG